jgi:transcriptional regulator with XRE-family HTH domain
MSEIGGELTTGERVRILRERKGMSREVLAGLVGRSVGWLRKIETNERQLRSLPMMVRLAEALRLSDVGELTGDDVRMPLDTWNRVAHPSISAIRDAVHGSLYRQAVPLAPQSAEVLSGRVSEAWRVWHTSRFQRTEVGNLLPGLIADIDHAMRQERSRELAVVSASLYALAQQYAAHIAEPELYWVMVDRSVRAAEDADDPTMLGAGAWVTCNGLRDRDGEAALRLASEAATDLRPRLEEGTDELRGIFGALCLSAAVTAAKEGRSGDAWRWHDEADVTAGRLPTGYAHPLTMFSSGNVAAYAVSLGTELKTPGVAVQRAEAISTAVPSVQRQSRMLVDAARAEWQRHEPAGAFAYLRAAHNVSPEEVRYVPPARALAAELARKTNGPLKAEAVALAEAVGVGP